MEEQLLNNEEIKQLYAITSEQPLPLTVPRVAKDWKEKILMFLKLVKPTRTLFIKPITNGARQRYSIYSRSLEMDVLGENITVERLHNIMASSKMDDFCKCIATVINNKKSEPPKWLVKTIEQFTNEENLAVLQILKQHIDVEAFLESIISITGMSLKPEEIIAPENEKKTRGEQQGT